MKKYLLSFLLVAASMPLAQAQRFTDHLDRGLIALPAQGGGNLVSWRLLAEEYYDVTYNVYRDGTSIATGLAVSNFRDASGTESSTYTVSAVVDGVEQPQCAAVQAWNKSYKEIVLTHEGIRSTLVPNDACCADVDGDGELEILMKFDNLSEMEQSYPKNGPVVGGVTTGEYSIFECLKLDGTRLWWVNCGPNMGDFQNNEQNIVAYDWDCDGKAEAVMRAADGTTIHMADGTTYTVGNASLNYRGATGGGTNWFMCQGNEYLIYMEGATGKPYRDMTYPLLRLEQGENDLNKAWGDGYGHRSSKYFFGAPYLDGHKPSIFLARGIYTRHKMIAYDVDPSTHQLQERWRWYNNTNGSWKGQGYHNYSIADVDMDGRDEIVYGSMIIDDCGMGLSTSGLGHGDAHHVGDFNPYVHGLELFACNEDAQGYNYRDATTSKIYKWLSAGKDVGRSMMGNFSDRWPGAIGSAYGDPISSVTNDVVSGMDAAGINTNFRIYWDGDLLEETFNYLNGKNTEGCIAKYGSWSPIYTCEGSMTNNDTKGTPCYQGDILGDWREEIIMRDANNNIRIYSTPVSTTYRNYTLWHDHQYRNAMVWQMCGYNQPPHVSYFLGKMEGITMAPPPLTLSGREQVTDGGTIGSSLNGKHALVCENGNASVTLEAGAQPSVLTFNVPTWVQGTGASECTSKTMPINYTTYTLTVSGGGMSGKGRLVKQGDGVLCLPNAEFTHTGETNIWEGTLNFDGKMKQSPLWLNRHTVLNSQGGEFCTIRSDYGSTICPGGADNKGTLQADSLKLGFGACLSLDLYGADQSCDQLVLCYLSLETKQTEPWRVAGPKYLAPVIKVNAHPADGESQLTAGRYVIATLSGQLSGQLSSIIVEGLAGIKYNLFKEDNQIILEIKALREAGKIAWTGQQSSLWDLAETENFSLNGEPTVFVSNDEVNFTDAASSRSVTVAGSVIPDTIRVNTSDTYTFKGTGTIDGAAKLVNEAGTVVMEGENSYTGGNYLRGGVTKVSILSNQYSAVGNLGGMTTSASKFTMQHGAELQSTAAVEMGSPMKMVGAEGGVINNVADFKMDKAISGTLLTKKGNGCLFLNAAVSVSKIVMQSGAMALAGGATSVSNTLELQGGILYDDAQNTTHGIYVPEDKSAAWHLTYTYYTAYSNKLTGKGTLTVVPRNGVSRVRITGDWSEFEGTVKHTNKDIWLPFDCSTGMPNATLDLADGCGASNVCKTFAIGALTGKGALYEPRSNFQSQGTPSGCNTWKVGNSWENGDFTFEGRISDGGGSNKSNFEKVGSCMMSVKGAWDNSGTVKINGGILKITGSGVKLGTGALTVGVDGILMGSTGTSSSLDNSSVTVKGILHVGSNEEMAIGNLTFNNQSVSIGSNGTLRFVVSKASTSATSMSGTYIKNVGTLTLDGTIVLRPYNYEPKAGDEIRLWSGVKSVKGSPTISLEGYEATFDISRLSEGVVTVLSTATGLEEINAENDHDNTFYNLIGQPVEHPTNGIYIHHGKKVIIK